MTNRNICFLFFCCFLATQISGCGSIKKDIDKGLKAGNGIIVNPDTAGWGRAWKSTTTTTHKYSDFKSVGEGYSATVFPPTTHSLSRVYMSYTKMDIPSSSKDRKNSLGDIKVIKTPDIKDSSTTITRERELKIDGKWVTVEEEEDAPTTVEINSYWKLDYSADFYVLDVEPAQIHLLPGVDIEVQYDPDYCKDIYVKASASPRYPRRYDEGSNWNNFFLNILASAASAMIDPYQASYVNGYETWEWSCPVSKIIVTEYAPDTDDLQAKANPKKLLPELAAIAVPATLKKGSFFTKNKYKTETPSPGVTRYTFQ